MLEPITKEEQKRILDLFAQATSAEKLGVRGAYQKLATLVQGACLALPYMSAPPHWTINIMCGRVDRMFKYDKKTKQVSVINND